MLHNTINTSGSRNGSPTRPTRAKPEYGSTVRSGTCGSIAPEKFDSTAPIPHPLPVDLEPFLFEFRSYLLLAAPGSRITSPLTHEPCRNGRNLWLVVTYSINPSFKSEPLRYNLKDVRFQY